MRVIAKRTLREFWQSSPKYATAQGSIEAWHAEVSKATWRTPQEVKVSWLQNQVDTPGPILCEALGLAS
jgi:mRNA-degrading endonuclease HigB of HigAB toxin-antitoxin module